MPRGGKRAGAGRKPGSANKKTRAVADRAAADGVTPLEVLLQAMRRLHEAEDWKAAAKIAADAAPYCHPRLGSVTIKGDKENPVRLEIVEELADAGDRPQDGAAAPGPA